MDKKRTHSKERQDWESRGYIPFKVGLQSRGYPGGYSLNQLDHWIKTYHIKVISVRKPKNSNRYIHRDEILKLPLRETQRSNHPSVHIQRQNTTNNLPFIDDSFIKSEVERMTTEIEKLKGEVLYVKSILQTAGFTFPEAGDIEKRKTSEVSGNRMVGGTENGAR